MRNTRGVIPSYSSCQASSEHCSDRHGIPEVRNTRGVIPSYSSCQGYSNPSPQASHARHVQTLRILPLELTEGPRVHCRMHKPKGARLKRLELPSTLGLLVRSLVLPILFPMVRPGRSRGGPRPRRPIPPADSHTPYHPRASQSTHTTAAYAHPGHGTIPLWGHITGLSGGSLHCCGVRFTQVMGRYLSGVHIRSEWGFFCVTRGKNEERLGGSEPSPAPPSSVR